MFRNPMYYKKLLMAIEKVNPSNLRKYLYEYALLALAGCVIYLFIARERLIEKMIDIRGALEKNSVVIERNTEAINRLNH